jgi:hypothetical protein
LAKANIRSHASDPNIVTVGIHEAESIADTDKKNNINAE